MPNAVQGIDPKALKNSEKEPDFLAGTATNVWNSVSGFFHSIKSGADDYSRKSLGLDNPSDIPIDRRSGDQLVAYRRPTAPAAKFDAAHFASVELLIIAYFTERLSQSADEELDRLKERAVARFEHKGWVTWTVGKIQDTANIQNKQGALQMAAMGLPLLPNWLVTPTVANSVRSIFPELPEGLAPNEMPWWKRIQDLVPTDAVIINSWQKQAQTACSQAPAIIQGWTQTQQMLGQSHQHKGSTFGQLSQERAQSAAGAKAQAKKQGDDDVQAATNLIQSAGQIAGKAASAA